MRFYPEIPVIRTKHTAEDIVTNTQNFIKAVENVIRESPENWFWLHKRWKTRPAGEEEKIY